MTLGEGLLPNSEEDGQKSKCEESNATNAETAITVAHFKDVGFLYSEEGDQNWVMFIARNINSSVKVMEVKGDGVFLTWSAMPPSDSSLIAEDHRNGRWPDEPPTIFL